MHDYSSRLLGCTSGQQRRCNPLLLIHLIAVLAETHPLICQLATGQRLRPRSERKPVSRQNKSDSSISCYATEEAPLPYQTTQFPPSEAPEAHHARRADALDPSSRVRSHTGGRWRAVMRKRVANPAARE